MRRTLVHNYRILSVLLLITASLLLGWSLWTLIAGSGRREGLALTNEIGGVNAKPADIPLAELEDAQDHLDEDVPPHSPIGVRGGEDFYHCPPEPFDFLRTHLGTSPQDALLRQQLNDWDAVWRKSGESTPPTRLEHLAAQSSLSPQMLLEAGRGLDFLAGDEPAACFFRAALLRASAFYRNTSPGDPAALPFLRELEETAALWRLKDYTTLEKRFALEMALYPPLSAESRRAGFLHARAVYENGRWEEAGRAMLAVLEQDKQAGDMASWARSDVGELDWWIGRCFYSARQYGEAIPYFDNLLQTDSGRRKDGARLLVNCLNRIGRAQEAQAVAKRFGFRAPLRGLTTAQTPKQRTEASESGVAQHPNSTSPAALSSHNGSRAEEQ